MTTPKIHAIIENFVSELSAALAEAGRDAIAEALGEARTTRAPANGRGHAKAGRTATRAKGAKRSAEDLAGLTQSLLAFVKRNPGQRIEQIGAAIGHSTKDLALPAKKLIAEKSLRTKGQKRATTYFAK
jgi:hypothetical protein